ncbi:hypothetical protein T09_15168 [Trichinella sp. T9]|nr:hypothetical protein T09_15168 [Trichinella sp. T9]
MYDSTFALYVIPDRSADRYVDKYVITKHYYQLMPTVNKSPKRQGSYGVKVSTVSGEGPKWKGKYCIGPRRRLRLCPRANKNLHIPAGYAQSILLHNICLQGDMQIFVSSQATPRALPQQSHSYVFSNYVRTLPRTPLSVELTLILTFTSTLSHFNPLNSMIFLYILTCTSFHFTHLHPALLYLTFSTYLQFIYLYAITLIYPLRLYLPAFHLCAVTLSTLSVLKVIEDE